jgi:ABC-2 type transport system permease protein
MDILKTATDWAKAEIFSTSFFIVFAIVFIIACIGFWQLGKTDMARAYIIPTLVAGILLLIIGVGLVYTNVTRVSQFETAYTLDATTFVETEMERVDRTLQEYRTIVFKAIPIIIIVAALLIVFVEKPIWRASAITTIAMMAVILLIDGTAKSRIEAYNEQLEQVAD